MEYLRTEKKKGAGLASFELFDHGDSISSRKSSVLSENDRILSIDDCLQLSGNFGRFQYFMLFLLMIVRNFGLFQVYGFALLLMAPEQYLWLKIDRIYGTESEYRCTR